MSTICGWEGKKQVWLIPLADETQGMQVKLLSVDNECYTLAP